MSRSRPRCFGCPARRRHVPPKPQIGPCQHILRSTPLRLGRIPRHSNPNQSRRRGGRTLPTPARLRNSIGSSLKPTFHSHPTHTIQHRRRKRRAAFPSQRRRPAPPVLATSTPRPTPPRLRPPPRTRLHEPNHAPRGLHQHHQPPDQGPGAWPNRADPVGFGPRFMQSIDRRRGGLGRGWEWGGDGGPVPCAVRMPRAPVAPLPAPRQLAPPSRRGAAPNPQIPADSPVSIHTKHTYRPTCICHPTPPLLTHPPTAEPPTHRRASTTRSTTACTRWTTTRSASPFGTSCPCSPSTTTAAPPARSTSSARCAF